MRTRRPTARVFVVVGLFISGCGRWSGDGLDRPSYEWRNFVSDCGPDAAIDSHGNAYYDAACSGIPGDKSRSTKVSAEKRQRVADAFAALPAPSSVDAGCDGSHLRENIFTQRLSDAEWSTWMVCSSPGAPPVASDYPPPFDEVVNAFQDL